MSTVHGPDSLWIILLTASNLAPLSDSSPTSNLCRSEAETNHDEILDIGDFPDQQDVYEKLSNDGMSSDESDNVSEISDQGLQENLSAWAVEHKITHSALRALL